MLPQAMIYNLWQPWLGGYEGVMDIYYLTWPKYAWIDRGDDGTVSLSAQQGDGKWGPKLSLGPCFMPRTDSDLTS